MPNPEHDVFTVGLGGAAGDGIREAGTNLGRFLAELGYEVYVSFTYPSLIRGGHNFARVSFSQEKIWVDHEKLDILIALNEETTTLHRSELQPDGLVLSDSVLPMLVLTEQLKAPAIARSSVALGAVCFLLDLPWSETSRILEKIFKNKQPEANLALAAAGYEEGKKLNFQPKKKIVAQETLDLRSGKKELVEGNSALARGLLAAGLDFYLGYPMTPATSILQFLAAQQEKSNVKVIQPESELAVINMALGIAYAGKRVAVGSATGGFALMTEALSFAGGAELPIVIVVSQRQAPATGVPTFSSQSDLQFVLHAGHGEFPRIVIAPGDSEEAFSAGAQALNLAWQYQLPVIVLLDKIVSEHAMTGVLNSDQIKIEPGARIVPGTPDKIVKVTSYEHDAEGFSTEDPMVIKETIDRRFAKGQTLLGELEKPERVKIFGDETSDITIVFWGSTKGPVLEAAKYLKRPVKLVQVLWLEPFPLKAINEALANAKKIISVEGNHQGQLAALMREKTGLVMTEQILKYDSRPFSPVELTEKINNLLD